MEWGCLPEPFLRSRKKLIHLKTIALALPLAPRSVPSQAVTDEANSTCPQYQTVPDFQRVQITGDYASGVGTSMAAPFPCWSPLLVPACPSAVPSDTGVCTSCSGEGVSQLSLCLTSIWGCPAASLEDPELNSLARAVGCCTLPMGFSRAGLAGRAVLTLSHPLCLLTALSV